MKELDKIFLTTKKGRFCRLKMNPNQQSRVKGIELGLENDDFIHQRITLKVWTDYPNEYLPIKLYRDGSMKSFSDNRLSGMDFENGYVEKEINDNELIEDLQKMIINLEI